MNGVVPGHLLSSGQQMSCIDIWYPLYSRELEVAAVTMFCQEIERKQNDLRGVRIYIWRASMFTYLEEVVDCVKQRRKRTRTDIHLAFYFHFLVPNLHLRKFDAGAAEFTDTN